MALDGIFLRHIKKEIEQTALGARVSQIYQPNRDELVRGGTLRLMLGHLSEQNNTPALALRTWVCELERAGMKYNNDFTLDIAPAATVAKSVIF